MLKMGWVASRQLLEQLQEEHPGLYPDSLLRTLQRRVKIWRQERVQEVIFGSPAIESAPREDHAHADAIAAPEFETAQRRVPGVMERKRRQAATAGRPAVAACGPDHTPRTGFQNHRVFGNILDEAKVQPRVTFLSETIRLPSRSTRWNYSLPALTVCNASAKRSRKRSQTDCEWATDR